MSDRRYICELTEKKIHCYIINDLFSLINPKNNYTKYSGTLLMPFN